MTDPTADNPHVPLTLAGDRVAAVGAAGAAAAPALVDAILAIMRTHREARIEFIRCGTPAPRAVDMHAEARAIAALLERRP